MMPAEDLREAPDFAKGVVKRSGSDADHVGLAEICLHPGGFEFLKQLSRMFVHHNGELSAVVVRRGRGDDGETLRTDLVQQKLQIAGEPE